MSKLTIVVVITLFFSCEIKHEAADLVIMNSTIYTTNEAFQVVDALAVKDGRILKVGKYTEIENFIDVETRQIDMEGKYVFPGFIEGHAHLMGIGSNLINVDLSLAESYREVIELLSDRAKVTPIGDWIIGRGWHQDKWKKENNEIRFDGFPTHYELSDAIPEHPVFLSHASGHAALVNAKAMELASIDSQTESPKGGEIFKDVSNQPTGIFNETATGLFDNVLPIDDRDMSIKKLELAMQTCFRNGITGFHDARSESDMINAIMEIAQNDELKLRLHLMLDGLDTALLNHYYKLGAQQGLFDNRLNIRSIKLYADGALGSRGAWLLEEYADAKDVHGHEVTPMNQIAKNVDVAVNNGFQVCTHAIGDRANREVLDIYKNVFRKYPDRVLDHRFRIEHAQHIHPEDIPRFSALGVLPAMQAIHMSSDRPWAIDRLGSKRIENGAYMWRSLIDNGSIIINGTDAPVEPVNPVASFYASVSRKTLQGLPENGFEPNQKMSREEALKSYTIWAAYGSFMEKEVGSIEEGKLADFTILDQDIMTIDEDEILKTQVVMTIIGGEIVYSNE